MQTATPRPLLTAKQARDVLSRRGETITNFAKRHDIPRSAVYHVLSGAKKGRNGDAHRAAVALGMKAGEYAPNGVPHL